MFSPKDEVGTRSQRRKKTSAKKTDYFFSVGGCWLKGGEASEGKEGGKFYVHIRATVRRVIRITSSSFKIEGW